MRNRSLLLASTALAVLGGASTAEASSFYVSVFGGANWLDDQTGVLVSPFSSPTSYGFASFDGDTGFILGAAMGVGLDNWLKGLSVEIEGSYRRNDVGGVWSSTGGSSGSIDANFATFAVMANAWYEIGSWSKVRPYVGGGIGWGKVERDGVLLTTAGGAAAFFDVDDSGFAWQLGAGILYEVMAGVDLGIGYRFFRVQDDSGLPFCIAICLPGGIHVDEIDNHTVLVNLKIDVD